MNRTALLVVGVLLFAAAGAAARGDTPAELREYAQLPVCTLGADGNSLAVQPCRTAPPRQPMPRRPVPQLIDGAPLRDAPRSAGAPLAEARPPGAGVRAAVPGTPPGAPLPSYTLPRSMPLPTAGCDPAGCLGSDGHRYNSAGPGTVIGPGGRVCSRNGALVQC